MTIKDKDVELRDRSLRVIRKKPQIQYMLGVKKIYIIEENGGRKQMNVQR